MDSMLKFGLFLRYFEMRILWALGMFLLVGCSNLENPRFSKGFYEEKRLQLTRKADLIEGDKTSLVAFATYLSDLETESYPKNEVFLVEIVFENEKIKPKDISYTLLGKKPIKVKKLSKSEEKKLKAYRHSPWNELFIVYFDAVLPIDIANVVLKMHVKGRKQELIFDYSYVVENIL